jgi:hypothetical protein
VPQVVEVGLDSRVAVVGYESVIGEGTNVWLRVYPNNPAPAG